MKRTQMATQPVQPTAEEAQPKRNKVPHLVCIITGQERITTREYLDNKLASKGISEQEFLDFYACREAVKLLRSGKSVEDTRTIIGSTTGEPVSSKTVEKILLYNGRQPKPKAQVETEQPAGQKPIMTIRPRTIAAHQRLAQAA